MPTLDLRRRRELDESDGPVSVKTEAHNGWSTGWLALVGPDPADPLNRLSRSFLNPDATSLSRAGNGDKTYGGLPDGVYEADSVFRSYAAHRTLFRVDGGSVTLYENADDAVAALNGITVATLRADRFAAQQRAEAARLARAQAAAAANAAAGLPPLTGSAKQVRWAETIRGAKLAGLLELSDRARAGEEDDAARAAEDAYRAAAARAEARWWIDHRDDDARTLARRFVPTAAKYF